MGNPVGAGIDGQLGRYIAAVLQCQKNGFQQFPVLCLRESLFFPFLFITVFINTGHIINDVIPVTTESRYRFDTIQNAFMLFLADDFYQRAAVFERYRRFFPYRFS